MLDRKIKDVGLLLLLVCYIAFIFYCTIIIREIGDTRGYNFRLFWGYIMDGSHGSFYFKENVLNVFLYIPLGLLLPLAFKRIRWNNVALFGSSLSIFVEVFQLIFKLGFCETDDVFHNTIGCLVGFFLFKGIITVYNEEKNQ